MPDEPTPKHSNLELAARAAGSTVAWAASGFTNVDDETYRRRLDTCADCEHLKRRPQQAAYALAGADEKICGLCGCLLRTKARLARAQCPAADPDHPGRNRWGDAMG